MASRNFDFSESQKTQILAAYGFVCAACGADDALHADHWAAGDSEDAGVCLCEFCNVKAKGGKVIPENFRLQPRKPLNVVTHAEYRAQVAANRESFQIWAAQFRFVVKGKQYRWSKFQPFSPAF